MRSYESIYNRKLFFSLLKMFFVPKYFYAKTNTFTILTKKYNLKMTCIGKHFMFICKTFSHKMSKMSCGRKRFKSIENLFTIYRKMFSLKYFTSKKLLRLMGKYSFVTKLFKLTQKPADKLVKI